MPRNDIVKRIFTTFVIVYSNLARMFASIGWFMGSLSYKTHYAPDVKYENYQPGPLSNPSSHATLAPNALHTNIRNKITVIDT